ncbi:MAG: helix-turn-helix domain-containing protein [Candidatus Sumerlaeia bacterium]|nr:helix-turn-helix domain-containing protein [Candidatus Sumerlaeia bacterium]
MLKNRVREARTQKGLSQQELADRSHISRSEVSAIENGRLNPSAEAAIRLAKSFQCRVEDLFWDGTEGATTPEWAWGTGASRFWSAHVPAGMRWFPVETLSIGEIAGDENARDKSFPETLVLATCDPSVGLLASELVRSGVRCLPLTRPSREALSLLSQGLVHAAVIHLCHDSEANQKVVQETLGSGYTMIHFACWEEGLAYTSSLSTPRLNPRSLVRHRWIGRPSGSGARNCSDELLANPKRFPQGYDVHARDHRGVAEAIRSGWAEVGVCVRLAAEEAGLGFLSIRTESVDICFRTDQLDSRPIRSLMTALQSAGFRSELISLPGYDASRCGEMAG